MSKSRREFMQTAFAGAGVLAGGSVRTALHTAQKPALTGAKVLPVQTPDLPKLKWEIDNGVKVFHLIAEPVKQEFLPGYIFDVWGFNGSSPGPTIEVMQGDRVRLVVENHLPEATAMHWHGFEIPDAMDGVPGVNQDPIPPGGRFIYEFTLHQAGTFFYHSHMAMQEMMGMIGLFIMHPQKASKPQVARDFGLILQEWAILPNNTIPNTMAMEFNWFTLNGKSGPATTPLLVRLGERVRIRMVNMGMDHHPMHLHGNTFYVTGTEGGRAPESAWRPENTVLVGVGQARDIEFDAQYPGDWMLHCHLPHHMMNHMTSMVGPMASLGHGMSAGMEMTEGMGMVQQGPALSAEHSPSLGRSMGVGTEYERLEANMPMGNSHALQQGNGKPAEMQHGTARSTRIPGYPQDMFVPTDQLVVKPETYGLRPTWSGGIQGMMTLVRVLHPELYDKIMSLIQEKAQ